MRRHRKTPNPHKQLVNRARKDYDAMLAAQGGVCAICGRKPEEGKRRFPIDHDHKQMYIRGVLCTRCNKWVWTFVNEEILLAALEYIRRGPEWYEGIRNGNGAGSP